MRDLLARYCDPHLQRPTINRQKSVCQNLIKKVVTSVILRSKLAAMAVVHQKPHQSRHLASLCSKLAFFGRRKSPAGRRPLRRPRSAGRERRRRSELRRCLLLRSACSCRREPRAARGRRLLYGRRRLYFGPQFPASRPCLEPVQPRVDCVHPCQQLAKQRLRLSLRGAPTQPCTLCECKCLVPGALAIVPSQSG
jgi:hypothetical protein